MEILQQVSRLPEGGLEIPVGSAVPGVDGGILGHQIHLAPGAHLLGKIRVLHIHEVALVKAAHRLEGAGAHTGKAAGVRSSSSIR